MVFLKQLLSSRLVCLFVLFRLFVLLVQFSDQVTVICLLFRDFHSWVANKLLQRAGGGGFVGVHGVYDGRQKNVAERIVGEKKSRRFFFPSY